MNPKTSVVFAGIVLGVLTASPVRAEVPTVADFAACNMKAAEDAASDMASASPRTDDAPRAGQLPPDARPKAPSASAPRGDVEIPPSSAGKAGATPIL